MHAYTVLGVAGFQRTTVGVQAAISGQQGRMNVEDAARERLDKRRCQYSHESGKHDELRRVTGDQRRQRGVIGRPIRKRSG